MVHRSRLEPFAFQKQVWAAVKNGQSGLLHASTGAGKTYAVWFGALNRFARLSPPAETMTNRVNASLWLHR
jgi:ATP-dependent Lhr-like helicase